MATVSDQVDGARGVGLRAIHAQVGRLVVRHRALRDHHQGRRALRWHEQFRDHRLRRTLMCQSCCTSCSRVFSSPSSYFVHHLPRLAAYILVRSLTRTWCKCVFLASSLVRTLTTLFTCFFSSLSLRSLLASARVHHQLQYTSSICLGWPALYLYQYVRLCTCLYMFSVILIWVESRWQERSAA